MDAAATRLKINRDLNRQRRATEGEAKKDAAREANRQRMARKRASKKQEDAAAANVRQDEEAPADRPNPASRSKEWVLKDLSSAKQPSTGQRAKKYRGGDNSN
jgi:hypothetical protein